MDGQKKRAWARAAVLLGVPSVLQPLAAFSRVFVGQT